MIMSESIGVYIHTTDETSFGVNLQENNGAIALDIGKDVTIFFTNRRQLDKFSQVVEIGSRMLFDATEGEVK